MSVILSRRITSTAEWVKEPAGGRLRLSDYLITRQATLARKARILTYFDVTMTAHFSVLHVIKIGADAGHMRFLTI
jgi:hypothetical protein